jgi:hypothetical protein
MPDRHAGQGAGITSGQAFVGAARRGERGIGRDRQKGVERLVVLLYAREAGACQLLARDFTRTKFAGKFGDRESVNCHSITFGTR